MAKFIIRGNSQEGLIAAFKAAFRDNGYSEKSDLSDPQIREAMDSYQDLRNRMEVFGSKLESLGLTGATSSDDGKIGKDEDDGANSSRIQGGTASRMLLEMRSLSPRKGKV